MTAHELAIATLNPGNGERIGLLPDLVAEAPQVDVLLLQEFNSLYPDCETHVPEIEPDWAQLPPHKRHRKTLPPGLRSGGTLVSDRRALSMLAEAGLCSAGCIAGT